MTEITARLSCKSYLMLIVAGTAVMLSVFTIGFHLNTRLRVGGKQTTASCTLSMPKLCIVTTFATDTTTT